MLVITRAFTRPQAPTGTLSLTRNMSPPTAYGAPKIGCPDCARAADMKSRCPFILGSVVILYSPHLVIQVPKVLVVTDYQEFIHIHGPIRDSH